MTLISIIYLITAALLTLYGLDSWLLIGLYLWHRQKTEAHPPLDQYPAVTVQLPIYNEMYVVERIIDAAVRLHYLPDRLQIQVLDDSTDETTAIAQAQVDRYRAHGVDIELLHRSDRQGFKAGALQVGLATAKGEFIAIFDADFVPQPDFLQQTIPHFLARPRLGMVQVRWGHINADYSPLTRIQAMILDSIFAVVQTARCRAGLLMNFNGTAGVWRRACIADAGGWEGDTVSEDLDLSYRAQIKGWELLFLPQVVAPAELPPQLNAFKQQQFRWAKGSMQVFLKLGRRILTAPTIPLPKRLQGLFYLSSYLAHPLLIVLLLTALPMTLWQGGLRLPLTHLSLISLGPPLTCILAQWNLYSDWRPRLVYLPLHILLGVGMALNSTQAIAEAVFRRGNHFRRTPKFHLERREDRWTDKRYVLPLNWLTLGEILLAGYTLLTMLVAVWRGSYYALPFLAFYLGGFGYVGLLGWWHSRPRLHRPGQPGQQIHVMLPKTR